MTKAKLLMALSWGKSVAYFVQELCYSIRKSTQPHGKHENSRTRALHGIRFSDAGVGAVVHFNTSAKLATLTLPCQERAPQTYYHKGD
jgi:hypothetical protein